MQVAVVSIAYLLLHFLTFICRFNFWNNLEPLMVLFSVAHISVPVHALSVEFGRSKPSSHILWLVKTLLVLETGLCFIALLSESDVASELITNLLVVLVPFAFMAKVLKTTEEYHPVSPSSMNAVIIDLDKL